MESYKVFKAVKYLNDKVISTKINQLIASLMQSIPKITQQAQITPQARQQLLTQIENSKRELLTALNTVIPSTMSIEESKIYEALGAYNLFGYEAQQSLTKAFDAVQNNPNSLQSSLQQFQNELTKIKQLYTTLNAFADKLDLNKELIGNRDTIIASFQGGVEINNLDELAKASAKWNQILIAFALLTKENDRAFKVESVEKGSIILTLTAMPAIVYGFAMAIDKILDVIKKYYEIKKLAHDASLLKQGIPEKTIHDLEAASKLKVKTETNEITNQLIEEYGWNADGQENRKDVDSAVRIAVRYLLEFINKGGNIDIKLLSESNISKKQMEVQLNIKYSEIKQIEKQVSNPSPNQMLELTDGDENPDLDDDPPTE